MDNQGPTVRIVRPKKQEKPKRTSDIVKHPAISITAIIALCVIVVVAMCLDIDGVMRMSIVGAICAIAGLSGGVVWGRRERDKD